MRIAYYPTFRALDHPRSSGLVSIARDVRAAMEAVADVRAKGPAA